MKPRLGITTFSTRGGLGYQTASYVKWLKPDKILDINITKFNGDEHLNLYPNARVTDGYPSTEDCEWFTDDVDVILMAETPLNYDMYKIARRKGVKTIVVINAEFYDHIVHPDYEMPDLIIMPSVWKLDEIRAHAESRGTKVIQIHHPVDRADFPFTLRTKGTPMHIAGKPATSDRNGTWDFMQACPDGTVTTQSTDLAWNIRRRFRHSNVRTDIQQPQQIYSYGDILVLPRKYGGNCLPLNEALSSGMPVIMTDISPNNHLLPKEWLVKAYKTDTIEPRTIVDVYTADPHELFERIQWVKDNIESQSKIANEIADTISWEALLQKWIEAIYA